MKDPMKGKFVIVGFITVFLCLAVTVLGACWIIYNSLYAK